MLKIKRNFYDSGWFVVCVILLLFSAVAFMVVACTTEDERQKIYEAQQLTEHIRELHYQPMRAREDIQWDFTVVDKLRSWHFQAEIVENQALLLEVLLDIRELLLEDKQPLKSKQNPSGTVSRTIPDSWTSIKKW